MAGSYVLPQVRVFQEFAETPNDVTQNLNPFVIGPNYQLIRYSDTSTRKDCQTGAYVGTASTELKWKPGYEDTKIDTGWYPVTFADAYIHLSSSKDTLTPASCPEAGVGATSATKFEFTLEGKTLADAESSDKLHFGIPVKTGDYLAYTVTEGTKEVVKYTKILSLSCGKLDTSTSEITADLKNRSTGKVSSAFTADASGYTGERATTVTITVTGAGTEASPFKIKWSSTTDISGKEQNLGAEAVDLGHGLKITKAGTTAEPFAAGVYVLIVKIHEPYARDTVTVADFVPLASGKIGGTGADAPSFRPFTFVRKVDAFEIDAEYTSSSDTAVTVDAGVKVDLGSSNIREVYSATAYLTQRNLITKHTDGVYSVSSEADIVTALGTIDTKNPLAYALRIMLLNCATATIKYTALTSDDAEGYAKALERASVTTEVYAFVPLTEDRTIIESVVAHCEKMSSAEEKSWRIAFFSMPTEKTTDVTPSVLGVQEKCKVEGKTLTSYHDAENKSSVEQCHFTDTVRVGDIVTVITTTLSTVTTKVVKVDSNNQLTLKDTVSDASSALCRFTITHNMETAEYVKAIATTSSSFRNRRAYNTFPNSMRDTNGETVSGMYGAAAVCALACSVAPQQPITNVEIKGFNDLPDSYSTYSRDQLNEIAAGGTLIIMQDTVGGNVYVRHQISTAYPDGNLNTTELSLTKNLDSISFYFANRFAPYIGRYNLTDELLTELKAILTDGLAYLETSTETNRLIGPQVIAEGTEIRALYRDTTEKDKAYANVALNLPAPFNNFDLRLQVI